ncbi:D-alanine--D-alanine ligase family protein [Dellaglioa algida]|uniref:D-alanine--D-alanine ligase family protein n=1 Tax=Dellaglioa algida TaxID=105612 RepID=UPI0024C49848|nr:D-alanine--D-alanine ligase family protein [Dellaglioa algida]MDK1728648.1 D-alanine--D-alanine ligase [Dellaglioa algida]MDK1736401.1 D-alanine--D-alanine ligase [Dellaglioa algida]MDK1738135.1 D-alanine--D-alanine ligase [Dellaglioa algida]
MEGNISMQVYLLYGGKSAEHEISLSTAFQITQAIYYQYYSVIPIYITRTGTWLQGQTITEPAKFADNLRLEEADKKVQAINEHENSKGIKFLPNGFNVEDSVVFPVLHGPNGEDGTVQGLLETLNIPYVGNSVLASAIGNDKIMSKLLFKQAGIPVVPFEAIDAQAWKHDSESVIARCEGELLYPMYVKPASLGSGIGVTQATDVAELKNAIDDAFLLGSRVIVERGIAAREIEIGLLGNEEIATSVPGEILSFDDVYDRKLAMKEDHEARIPVELDDELLNKLVDFSKRAFAVIDGSGLARCDFFISANQDIYLNEITTMPGFYKNAMYPRLWEAVGLSYSDLIEELLQLALKKNQASN